MKPKKLGDLWKRQEELRMLISVYEVELTEVERQITHITGENSTSYDKIYDDEDPDYIRQSQEEI